MVILRLLPIKLRHSRRELEIFLKFEILLQSGKSGSITGNGTKTLNLFGLAEAATNPTALLYGDLSCVNGVVKRERPMLLRALIAEG